MNAPAVANSPRGVNADERARPTLEQFVSWCGNTARKLFVCGANPPRFLAKTDVSVLQVCATSSYELQANSFHFALSPKALYAEIVNAIPKSVLRMMDSAELLVADGELAGEGLSKVFVALNFSSEARDLVVFVDGAAGTLDDWRETDAFAVLTARLKKLFKQQVKGYRLHDGLLVHCSQINIGLLGDRSLDSIVSRLSRSEAEAFFSDGGLASWAPPVAANSPSRHLAEFIGRDALNDRISVEARTLQPLSVIRFPQPEWILDLSGAGLQAFLIAEQTLTTAECLLYRVHSHAVVRGTNAILLPGNKLLLMRQLGAERALELRSYLKRTRNWVDHAETFHCGIFFRDDDMMLGEKKSVVVDDHLLVVTPDEYLNYGMWLLQAVPALLHCEQHGFEGALLCPDALPWQRSIIDSVAPNVKKRIVSHEPGFDYMSSGATSFIGSSERSFCIGPYQKLAYSEIRDRMEALGSRAQARRRIYVSRFQSHAETFSNRVLVNELELILRLKALGFEIVAPETMAFSEQVRTFANAEIVIGPGGAAMFNCVFCRPNTIIVTIESNTNWVVNHCRLFASLDVKYGVAFGRQLEPSEGPHSPWRLDVDAFVAHIRARMQI